MNCVLFAKMDQVFSKENKTLKKNTGKLEKNTGKVREKSGNFVSPEKWEPCHGSLLLSLTSWPSTRDTLGKKCKKPSLLQWMI